MVYTIYTWSLGKCPNMPSGGLTPSTQTLTQRTKPRFIEQGLSYCVVLSSCGCCFMGFCGAVDWLLALVSAGQPLALSDYLYGKCCHGFPELYISFPEHGGYPVTLTFPAASKTVLNWQEAHNCFNSCPSGV